MSEDANRRGDIEPELELPTAPSHHWLTRVTAAASSHVGAPPSVVSVSLFGLPPSALVGAYLWTNDVSLGFTVGCVSVIGFLLATPTLIYRYDARLYPTFFHRFGEVVDAEAKLEPIAEAKKSLFTRRYWLFSGPAAVLGVPMMVAGRPFLRTEGVAGVTDPFYWGLFAVVLWLGVLIGIGVTGVATTVGVIRAVTSERIQIDPLHPDGRAGLSIAGSFAVRTTVMFAMGSLLLPVQLHYVSTVGQGWLTGLLYVLIGGYTVVISLSFVYPVVQVTRPAERERERQLEHLRREYERVRDETESEQSNEEMHNVRNELHLQRLRQEYRDYERVTLYPTRVDILSRLAGSVLLPLAFVLVDTAVSRPMVRDLLGSLL